MFSGLVATTLALTLGGAPVKLPEVTNADGVKTQMGQQVVVLGQLERVAISKGKGTFVGTAIVLDDDTTIYVTYAEPPEGWAPLLGSRIKVEGLLRPSLSEHEQSLMAPHLRSFGKPTKQPRKLSAVVGQHVRLSGLARDAKGGAAVVIDGSPLYLQGLESWPMGVNGKTVVVGGTLVDKKHLPEATKNAKGEWTQGAQGSQLVLEQPTWALLEPEVKK